MKTNLKIRRKSQQVGDGDTRGIETVQDSKNLKHSVINHVSIVPKDDLLEIQFGDLLINGTNEGKDLETILQENLVQMSQAAVRIQACFRGWLLRTNLKMVTKCTTKIQAAWRGSLARFHYKRLIHISEKKKMEVQKQQASTRWKKTLVGAKTYSPRLSTTEKVKRSIHEKERFPSTHQYSTQGQERQMYQPDTEDLDPDANNHSSTPSERTCSKRKSNIYEINPTEENQLYLTNSAESLASSTDGSTLLRRMGKVLHCLETILRDSCGEDLNRISATHIQQLVTYLDSNPTATKSEVCEANSLAKLFPPIPSDVDGFVKPDEEKISLLKNAIKLLRRKIEAWETQKLYPLHHLARTDIIPGIFSDPFSSDLTEIEKKLTKLEFWDPERSGEPYVSPAKVKTENTKHLSELMELDPDEQNTLEKIYNFKLNYFLTGDDGDISGNGLSENFFERIKTPPPFTTLFKANNPKSRRN